MSKLAYCPNCRDMVLYSNFTLNCKNCGSAIMFWMFAGAETHLFLLLLILWIMI